ANIKTIDNIKKNNDFKKNYKKSNKRPLTLMYAVGGAGSLIEIGYDLLKSLKEKIISDEIRIILSAGIRLHVRSYYETIVNNLGLANYLGKSIIILFELTKEKYFETFNKLLRETDILWTKPSELSFYCALGLPIIIAPPVGAHENYNREWLLNIGSGFIQENPKYAADWLFYWLQNGRLARSAFQGFLNAPVDGTYNIEEYLKKQLNKL
ncbi:MAG: hypothetical protein QXM96_04245, partial [Candidatus Woesearchaeota archaeon]